MKSPLTEFESYLLKRHPDPDSITHVEESKDRSTCRVYVEWEPIMRLAEDYAQHKIKKTKKTSLLTTIWALFKKQ